MTHHVIVGGGPAATNAVETIRQFDAGATITLVSDEPAHSRMALPYWLAGNIPREQTYTGDDAYFEKLGVETRFGLRVERVDPQGNSLTLSDGGSLSFERLLIATGSSPVAPPIDGVDLPGVQPLWTLAHTDAALRTAKGLNKTRVAFIGAGFIGFIVLGAMYKRGWKLSVVERETHVLPRMLDADSARMAEDWLKSKNVALHCGTTVREIRQADGGVKQLLLENGGVIDADLVVVATGIKPNIDLIDGSGIETDNAILVNDRMQTNFPNIYAAGDVAQGPVLFSNDRQVHAIQPTAVDHGRVAGANMAGQQLRYSGSLLMNIVDICGLQAASFGAWDDGAEAITINNPVDHIYRKMLFNGDRMTGAIFAGRANDMGMLTDVGMVKGILQTQTPLGDWKNFLRENPFDVRRAYIGAGVPQKLAQSTLLGRPSQPRGFHHGGAQAKVTLGQSHAAYVGTKQ